MIDDRAYDDLAYIYQVSRDSRLEPELELIELDQADVLRPSLKEGQQVPSGEAIWEGRETRLHYVEQLEEQGWVRIRRSPGGVHWVRITLDGRTVAQQRLGAAR